MNDNEPEPADTGMDAPAALPRLGWGRLVVGAVVAVAASILLLVVAGSWGFTGVVIVAALQAVAAYLLYRWSPSS